MNLFHLIMGLIEGRGTPCISLNLDKKVASISKIKDRSYVFVDLGTKEGNEALEDRRINKYAVDLEYEQELTLFHIKRQRNNSWYALQKINGNTKTFDLGISSGINFEKLIAANVFFKQAAGNIGL